VFLVTIAAVPIAETGLDLRANLQARRALQAQGVPVEQWPSRRPKVLDAIDLLPPLSALWHLRQLNQALPAPWQIRQYEDRLVNESRVGLILRPWMQAFLTERLGVGSQSVTIGHDGSLFYEDGVRYTIEGGFLDERALAARRTSGVTMPDPRPAIMQFHRELQAANVSLLLLPIPDKSMVQAGRLARTTLGPSVPQNPSWATFMADLQRAGVTVLDLGQQMYDAERAGTPQFLHTDSHWTPAAVSLVANRVAATLRALPLEQRAATVYRRASEHVTRLGDLALLLGLPASKLSEIYGRESLDVEQVTDATGAPWQPDPASDVLFIGDSFLEMYSGQHWQAGLAEQVSFLLQHPVDRIASHHWGPYGEREGLGNSVAAVRQGARTRRVVVWEFAMRRLAFGSWRLLP
jgi:alginate O-acetyltransferase complex protein AlgJ